MSVTLAYDAAQERRYQRQLERAEARAKRLAEIETELKVTFLAASNGADVKLPFVRFGALAGRGRRVEQPFAEALSETLEYAVPLQALMQVLRHSECPLVAQLKLTLAQQYATNWGADLAELEEVW